jgi:CheY-like chemotaxis protein
MLLMKLKRRDGWVLPVITALAVGVFVLDLLTSRGVPDSILYVIPVVLTIYVRGQLWPLVFGAGCSVLTDMVMPGGMTGREMAERLWEQKPALKVIFTSGYDRENAGRDTDFIRRNKSYFLQKPCSSRKLIETVRQSLDEKWEGPGTMLTPQLKVG